MNDDVCHACQPNVIIDTGALTTDQMTEEIFPRLP